MHPRNIFKKAPDFKELSKLYDEFKQHVILKPNGSAIINFQNPDSLRTLSKILLLHYFSLDVEIPPNTLTPTIPLRVNYVLFLEDLANFLDIPKEDVRVVDIGTGATCIYPLLMSKTNNWRVLATESNPDSVEVAKRNVINNCLEGLINVVQSQTSLLKDSIGSESYTFCMCNPPFFAKPPYNENHINDRGKRTPPRNAPTGTDNELSAPGGEVEFINQIITESKELGTQISVYTSMIGHKKNVKILKENLKENGVTSFVETIFQQGKTTRWCLAWSFHNIDLRNLSNLNNGSKINSKAQTLIFETKMYNTIEDMEKHIIEKLTELKMKFSSYKSGNVYEITATGLEDTWSNARRKRREARRQAKNEETDKIAIDKTNEKNIDNRLPDDSKDSKSNKRKLESDDSETKCSLSKKIKIEENIENVKEKVIIKLSVMITKTTDGINLKFFQIGGEFELNSLSKIYYYIVNSIK